ncbi:MAG: hypothetical protein JNK73_08895 [Bacteroidia bacterium]|nr:hypothetical protein [Bacteroidia bacterium]
MLQNYIKHSPSLLLLTCVLILNFTHCKKKNSTGSSSVHSSQEKLPVETQEGKNTFGCLINGKVWIAERGANILSDNRFSYQVNTTDNTFYLGAKKLDAQPFQKIELFARNIGSVGTFKLSRKGFGLSTIYYDGKGGEFLISDTLNSEIKFSKFDAINNIISGTFRFNFFKDSVEYKITNGVFDIKLEL